MTFVVPFDDSDLSRAALVRARDFGEALDEPVVSISVVPSTRGYAREKGWIGADDEFHGERVTTSLRASAKALAPSAEFRVIRAGMSVGSGTIARLIREEARDLNATVVFLGSENAGGIVIPVSSVGGSVAADDRYDVYIVRRDLPSGIEKLGGNTNDSV